MGRNSTVPHAGGLTDAEREQLEALRSDDTPTFRQRAVGRVVGTLYLRHGGRVSAALLSREVAVSLGLSEALKPRGSRKQRSLKQGGGIDGRGSRLPADPRGLHCIAIAVATGYVERIGQDAALTEDGISLAERATGKARAEQGLPPLDDASANDEDTSVNPDEGEKA